MLQLLRVRAFAIIDELSVEFGPGLQVVTGETGAGKSILVDALQLVVGARGSAESVRAGSEEAEVEALFHLGDAPAARAMLLEAFGIDDDELVVRRVVKATGRSRAYVNGHLATAQQLAAVAGPLVDICSQHQHHSLSDPTTHLEHLDAFADLAGPRTEMQATWTAYQEATSALHALAAQMRVRRDREALLRLQLQELDAVDPQPGEDVELAAEHGRLAHAQRLAATTRRSEALLYANDGAVLDVVAKVTHDLDALDGVDPELDALRAQLAEAAEGLEAVSREFGRYARGISSDPQRLAEVEQRMADLKRLARKYGRTSDLLVPLRAEMRQELADLDDADERMERLEAARLRASDRAISTARTLSEARRLAAQDLGRAITTELGDLGMGDAQIEVSVAPLERRSDDLAVDGARIASTGMDQVAFLIAPNRGEPPRPLQRIASGGELSRALLAVERVLAQRGPQALHVFDEVDTGVGGAVAEAIGRKLAEVSRERQVLCITHLPQIAVYGDKHMVVSKRAVGDRTHAEIKVVADAARTEEIARMMGGLAITAELRAAAATMLRDAAR